MAEKSKQQRKGEDSNELRAGATVDEERDAKKVAREGADDEVLPQNAVEEPIIEVLPELPEDGVVLVKGTASATDDHISPNTIRLAQAVAPAFADQFHGIGGSYVIDAETGERKRQYEEITNDKGKVTGYRPVP